MSRCISFVTCGLLFLGAGAVASQTFGAEFANPTANALPITAADFRLPATDTTFGQHRLELGSATLQRVSHFRDDSPSPLFATPAASPDANAHTSEWDYLWRNPSRIPVTAIPEPSAAALLLAGALLFGSQRVRARRKRH